MNKETVLTGYEQHMYYEPFWNDKCFVSTPTAKWIFVNADVMVIHVKKAYWTAPPDREQERRSIHVGFACVVTHG